MTTSLQETRTKRGIPHPIRFLLLLAAMIFTYGGLFFGAAFVLRRTAYRTRDILMLLVPLIAPIVLVRCCWRFTASSVYWQPRAELASATFDEVAAHYRYGPGQAGR